MLHIIRYKQSQTISSVWLVHMSNNVTSLTRSESCNAWDNQKGSICRQTEQGTGGLDYAIVIGVLLLDKRMGQP